MATTTAGIPWTTMGVIFCKERMIREPLRYEFKTGAYSLTRRWYLGCSYELLAGLLTANALTEMPLTYPDTIPTEMMLPYDPLYALPVTLLRRGYRIFWYEDNAKCELEAEYKGHEIAFCNVTSQWNGVVSYDWEAAIRSERRIFSLDVDGDGQPLGIGANNEGVNAKTAQQTRIVTQNIGAAEYLAKESLYGYLLTKVNTAGWQAPWMVDADGVPTGETAAAGEYLYLAPQIERNEDYTYTVKHRFEWDPERTNKHRWYFSRTAAVSVGGRGVPQKVAIGEEQVSTIYQEAVFDGLFDPCFVATTTA